MTRIDRRGLFTSGAAAALLAASGVSLSAEPRPGGRLRLAVPRGDGSFEAASRGAVFDTLTEVAPNGVLQGELASGWKGSADARIWAFELRNDVIFHDESVLGAADVVSSLAAHESPVLKNATIEATGALTLRVELTAGNPDLPYQLADPALVIARCGAVDDPLAQAIGTGPYRVSRARDERQFLGSRVQGHYRDGHAGWVEEIEIAVIPDPAVRAEALRDGFVDVAALPLRDGLVGKGEFIFHPSAKNMALAARRGVGVPRVVGERGPLDDGRIAKRWWMA